MEDPQLLFCDDEEFYENIEAPKFVDFTDTCRTTTDDGYWFCSRVGCDRKHEEEIDHETVSKNFFLRVMAARSPNVKFQKAINKRANEECPLSVPAKSSKSRVSRLVEISLFSQKMDDVTEKVEPLSNIISTSKGKRKQVASRYLTSKVGKLLPLQSGGDSKPAAIEAPESEAKSKTLVLQSPKNIICEKTSLELCTPLTKIGAKMKKLEITSQWKRILGYSKKVPTDTRSDHNKTAPEGPSKKQVSDCKDKGKARGLFKHRNCDNLDGHKNRKSYSIPNQKVKIERKDRITDAKSRDAVGLGTKRNAREERPVKKVRCSEVAPLGRKMNFSTVEDQHLEDNDHHIQFPSLESARNKSEFMGSNDKENVCATDQRISGRDCQHEKTGGGRNLSGNEEAKVISEKEGKLKEHCSEYRRPKPTNPKPFRLRTDERGILKEGNSERRIQTRTHLKENEDSSVLRKGTMQKRLRANIQKNNKCIERSKYHHRDESSIQNLEKSYDTSKGKEADKSTQKITHFAETDSGS